MPNALFKGKTFIIPLGKSLLQKAAEGGDAADKPLLDPGATKLGRLQDDPSRQSTGPNIDIDVQPGDALRERQQRQNNRELESVALAPKPQNPWWLKLGKLCHQMPRFAPEPEMRTPRRSDAIAAKAIGPLYFGPLAKGNLFELNEVRQHSKGFVYGRCKVRMCRKLHRYSRFKSGWPVLKVVPQPLQHEISGYRSLSGRAYLRVDTSHDISQFFARNP